MKNTLIQTAITFAFFAALAIVGLHEAAKRCHDPAQHEHVCAVPERAGVQTTKTVEQLYDGGDYVGTVTTFDYVFEDQALAAYEAEIAKTINENSCGVGTAYTYANYDDIMNTPHGNAPTKAEFAERMLSETESGINQVVDLLLTLLSAAILFAAALFRGKTITAATALTLTATTLTAQTPTWHDDTGRGMHMALNKADTLRACGTEDFATKHMQEHPVMSGFVVDTPHYMITLNRWHVERMRRENVPDGTEYTLTDDTGRVFDYVYHVQAEPEKEMSRGIKIAIAFLCFVIGWIIIGFTL